MDMPCTAFAIWNALRKALVNNLAPMHKPDLGPTLPPPPMREHLCYTGNGLSFSNKSQSKQLRF